MRTLFLTAALLLAALFVHPGLSLAGPLDQSIPWHERSIESRKAKIAEYEGVLHEYDAELRALDPKAPAAAKRRTEIRIIKRYYNEQIDDLKAQIIDHYKAIRDLKAKGGS